MGIEFRKILFFAMLMNDTEKSTLKITTKKIVNLEMFASVRATSIIFLHCYESP